MRFEYKPDKPLYVVALRCYALAQPRTVVNDWSYGGCKSWVPLKESDAVDDADAAPVLGDPAFAAIVSRVDAALTGDGG